VADALPEIFSVAFFLLMQVYERQPLSGILTQKPDYGTSAIVLLAQGDK